MNINTKTPSNNGFSTYDLNLAAALVSLGFKLEALDKTNPRKVCFLFRKNQELEKTIQAFWEDQIKISPQKLFNSQKLLKNRIYSDY